MSTTRVREVRKEAARASYAPRLKTLYEQELRGNLKNELDLSSTMEVPRIEKITLNMGVGEAKTDAKQLDSALEELTIIAGQRAQVRRGGEAHPPVKNRGGMAGGARGEPARRPEVGVLHRRIADALPPNRHFSG